jgi:cytidine deaminase
VDVDWAGLRAAAVGAMERAYAPYSGFPVGVAGLVDDGRVVVGCNVENASYGVGLCAECGMVSALHLGGGGRLVAVACVDAAGAPLMPCGRCRQLLWENGGPECLVDAPGGALTMAELLPAAFGPADLDRPRSVLPPRLREWHGRGTVFVHPDADGGRRVWTAYWERSNGFGPDAAAEPADSTVDAADVAGALEEAGILEEGPQWPTAAEAVAWAKLRTTRVVVVDADGKLSWAGVGPAPVEVSQPWSP